MTILGDGAAFLLLIVVGFLPNEIWRALGFFVGGGLDESSEILVWVRYVATAILAGVIAQLLIVPPGALANVPAMLRYGAVLAGVAGFFVLRRSPLAGVLTAEAVLVGGMVWLR
jgi:hypothetical protein